MNKFIFLQTRVILPLLLLTSAQAMANSFLGSSFFGPQAVRSNTDCPSIPPSVTKAFREAKDFSTTCPAAKLAPGRKIAISDYSTGTPTMYIIDQSGECMKSLPVAWGSGKPKSGAIRSCSVTDSNMTPPGFHLTARHDGGTRYGPSNSVGLAGLSGQNSLGARGVLIHATAVPGTACTWGCTGVAATDFKMIQEVLGVGSLVYNYFGDQPSDCPSSAGLKPTCDPEPLAVKASNEATGNNIPVNYQPATGGGSSSGNSRSKSGAK